MMIQWFEDKINHSIPPTEESLSRLSRYAQIYAKHGAVAASLACVLCRLVVECKVKGSSVYGALQSYTGENKVYYLPNLPLPSEKDQYDFDSLEDFLHEGSLPADIENLGGCLCAIFPLAKRLQVDPDKLLFVAIMAAELLFASGEEMEVPIQIDIEQVEALFGL